MIKFFRKIRQRLLSESPPEQSIRAGKFSKYLIYAIGEIILVVIGILIALQINNWNEQKSTRAKERQALMEIRSDLETNITSLNEMIYDPSNGAETCLKTTEIVTMNLEETKTFHDSLLVHYTHLFNYPYLVIKRSGYESLTSIGMDLISNPDLRSEIGSFYSYRIPMMQMATDDLREDFYHYMIDFMSTHFYTRTDEQGIVRRFPTNYDELAADQRFIESLKTYYFVLKHCKEESTQTLSECESLHQKVMDELQIQ